MASRVKVLKTAGKGSVRHKRIGKGEKSTALPVLRMQSRATLSTVHTFSAKCSSKAANLTFCRNKNEESKLNITYHCCCAFSSIKRKHASASFQLDMTIYRHLVFQLHLCFSKNFCLGFEFIFEFLLFLL